MFMGIGRGDSARRVIGLEPVKMAEFERSLVMIKDLMNGRPVEWNGKELELKWAKGRPEIPIYVAGYGPKALGVAGRVGDGVVIQLADPTSSSGSWASRATGGRGGRPRPGRAQVPIVCAPGLISDDLAEGARAGALVSGDGLEPRHGPARALPPSRSSRRRSSSTSSGASSTTTRTTAASAPSTASSSTTRPATASASSARPSRHAAKLRELEAIGVAHWNIYLMTEGQEEMLEAYGRDIIPQFAQVTT